MAADLEIENAFELETELRSIEQSLDRERRQLREEMTAAFRRLNGDALHDAAERTYPFTTAEKQAARRQTVGPVELLPEWEETYRAVAADQRTARERLAAFHRDVFAALAADEPYTVSVTDTATAPGRPYLELVVRYDDRVAVFAIDNPDTEGYAFRGTDEYTTRDIANALSLCADVETVDAERLGLLTYNTDLVDFTAIRNEVADPDQLRRRVQLEILETLTALDYDALETEESPLLTVIETVAGTELAGE